MKHSLPLLGKRGRSAVFTAISALVLLAVFLLGIGVSALMSTQNVYIDATPEGLYTLTDAFLGEVAGIEDEIRITFCADPDTLLENDTTRYVYIMAREIEKAMPNVKVETYNIERNPTAVQEFRTTSSTEISWDHVIVSCNKRYRMVKAAAFWSTDTNTNTFFAFNGEYKMATIMLSITAIERPVAYFTVGHGEGCYLTASEAERERHRAFYQLLLDGGMEVRTLELDTVPAVPDDCVLLIMNGPTSDYTVAAEDILAVNATPAIEKVDRYLDDAGALMVFKDPMVSLPVLEEFLTEWGIACHTGEVVRDTASGGGDALQNGTSEGFVAVYPDKEADALGYQLFGEVAGLSSAPGTVIAGSGYLSSSWVDSTKHISSDTSAMTSAVFRAPATARTFNAAGELTGVGGNYELARLTTRVSVVENIEDYYSYVFCAAGTSLTDTAYLDDATLGNYDVMFSTVRFVSRTDVYASDALGGLNMNTQSFGGKRLQSASLSATPVEKYEKGELVHVYPAMTPAVRTVWTVLILLVPAAVAITGIVLCVRRRYR